MDYFSTISSLASAAKSAYDLAQRIKSSKMSKEDSQLVLDLMQSIIEIQNQIIEVREQRNQDNEERRSLQEQLMAMEQWKVIESDYVLKEFGKGALGYVLKPGVSTGDAHHMLCTNCWENRVKSILLSKYHSDTEACYCCPRCKAEIKFYPSRR